MQFQEHWREPQQYLENGYRTDRWTAMTYDQWENFRKKETMTVGRFPIMDPQVLSQSFVYETIKIGGTNPECDVIRESGRHTGKTNADTHSFKGSQLCSRFQPQASGGGLLPVGDPEAWKASALEGPGLARVARVNFAKRQNYGLVKSGMGEFSLILFLILGGSDVEVVT